MLDKNYMSFEMRLKNWIKENENQLKLCRKEAKYSKINSKKGLLESLERSFKIGETSISTIMNKILQDFLVKEKEKIRRKSESLISNVSNFEVIELDDDGNIISGGNITTTDFKKKNKLRRNNDREALLQQKELLSSEIQNLSKGINDKRETMMRMLGLTKALDLYLKDCKEVVVSQREPLKKYREKILEDEELSRVMFLQTGGIEGYNFFERGSKINIDNYSNFENKAKKNKIGTKQIADMQFHCQNFFTHGKKNLHSWLKLLRFSDVFKQEKKGRRDRDKEKFQKMDSDIKHNEMFITNKEAKNKEEYLREEEMSMVVVEEVQEVVDNEEEIEKRLKEMRERVELRAKEEAERQGVDEEDIIIVDDNELLEAQNTLGISGNELLDYENDEDDIKSARFGDEIENEDNTFAAGVINGEDTLGFEVSKIEGDVKEKELEGGDGEIVRGENELDITLGGIGGTGTGDETFGEGGVSIPQGATEEDVTVNAEEKENKDSEKNENTGSLEGFGNEDTLGMQEGDTLE